MASTWFIVVGVLFVLVALLASSIDRWPVSTGLIYLAIGVALGPAGAALFAVDLERDARALEHLFEATVLISLFTVGLKLRSPVPAGAWASTFRLAVVALLLTIGGVTCIAHALFALSWREAFLLGAILAPTDPVLASDVQIDHAHDRDRLRLNLTSEGGANDITAFPIVMLALGVNGLHDLGPAGVRWLAFDVVWAALAALAIGWMCGRGVGALALRAQRTSDDPIGLAEFIALGVIALSYGIASLVHGLGFLAVFAAGLAMRRTQSAAPQSPIPAMRDGSQVPSAIVRETLAINERLARLAEVAAVLTLGALVSGGVFARAGLGLAVALFVVVRPVAVAASLARTGLSTYQRALVAWFGIRGVGSLYYLMFALAAGLSRATAERLAPIVLAVVAASILVHGVTATPLMRRYRRAGRRGR